MTTRLPRVGDADLLGGRELAGDDRPHSTDSLQHALRRARLENAERAGVVSDLRAAQVARLEHLQDALQPLLAQVPPDVDLFDVGLTHGSEPRLFIDAVCFVEMSGDARLYRLRQDTRRGRLEVLETDRASVVVNAVTNYVARRLIERDKALGADDRSPHDATAEPKAPALESGAVRPARPRPMPLRLIAVAFAFVIDLLGSLVLLALCCIAVWFLWSRLIAPR